MNRKKLLSLLLACAMVLSMAGCGGGEVVPVDETKQLPNGVIGGSETFVDNEGDANGTVPGVDPGGTIPSEGELPGDNPNLPSENTGEDLDADPSESPSGDPNADDPNGDAPDGDDPNADPSGDPDGGAAMPSNPGGMVVVSPGDSGEGPGSGTVDRPGGNGSNTGGDGKYRFQRYVLGGAANGNFVFSGEAIMKSVNMWSEMILDPDHRTINKYLARDYLEYEDNNGLELISRIWVDDPLDLGNGAGRLSSLFYQMDMGAETATADKDDWVAKRTDDYILSTPAKYDSDTKVDLMTVPYYSDTWKAGTLHYDTKVRAFQNQDGTETRTYMCWDEGLTYWDMGNAKAYCMYLTGGNYAMFIVPNEGVELDKINVASLMSGKIESKRAHVVFLVPPFEVESEHAVTLGDFGLPSGKVGTDVISNLSRTFEPEFTQLTKVSLTPYGIGPVPSTEGRPDQVLPPSESDFTDGEGFVRIVCDKPFLYYIGDAWNEDIAFFGVTNTLPADQAIEIK